MAIFSPYQGLTIKQGRRFIAGQFTIPHKVISTCRAHGGIRTDLTCVFNQQACEPSGHSGCIPTSAYKEPNLYLELTCAQYDLPAATSAMLSTAANMHCAAMHTETFEDLQVTAIVTGGVEGNAGRAGDYASYVEREEGVVAIQETDSANPNHQGTINTLVFINKELTDGALARSIMMATEAKASVLQELSVPSRYSESIATGTGTDQIAVSCKCHAGKPLTDAGKHSKLGELIAKAVRKATRDTLYRQNGLSTIHCGSIPYLLKRFGVTEANFIDKLKPFLSSELVEVCSKNVLCLCHDPATVAAIAALVHVHDQCSWDIIPPLCHADILLHHSAMVSCSVSLRFDLFPQYKETLEIWRSDVSWAVTDYSMAAIALGFSKKWSSSLVDKEE